MRTERDRRDWSLLIFIIPLGILLMLVAGQLAMRIIPQWILNAGMGSYLDVDTAGQAPIPLFNMQILTPFAWQSTYLTPDPGSGFVFPPFIVIQPTVITVIPTIRPTEGPHATATPGSVPTATVQPPPTATNYVPPLPTATKNNPTEQPTSTEPGPSETATDVPTETATNTPVTPSSTPITPSPTSTGYPSTPPGGGYVPPNIETGTPDGNPNSIPPGSYTVVDITSSPIIVVGTSETSYDLVFFENAFVDTDLIDKIHLDQIILGISKDPLGNPYFEIFNWANGIQDFNSNVNFDILPLDPLDPPICSTEPECNNRRIRQDILYTDPGTGISTGILIDVDTAPSKPPPGSYGYLIIISPSTGTEGSQIDSILIFP